MIGVLADIYGNRQNFTGHNILLQNSQGITYTLTSLPSTSGNLTTERNELISCSSFASNSSVELLADIDKKFSKCQVVDTKLQPLLNYNQTSKPATESHNQGMTMYITLTNSILLFYLFIFMKYFFLDEVHNFRLENYVYQVLMETGEGEFLIQLYDFEQDKENYKNLIESKKEHFSQFTK